MGRITALEIQLTTAGAVGVVVVPGRASTAAARTRYAAGALAVLLGRRVRVGSVLQLGA